MADFEAKAKEIIAGFLPYIGGPAWNEKAENLIIAALAEEREACAALADYWGSGKWHVKFEGRSRFSIYHMQNVSNTTGREIAKDIRARETESEPSP